MEKRRLRHGLAVAAIGILVATAIAAALYGIFVLAIAIYWQGFEF